MYIQARIKLNHQLLDFLYAGLHTLLRDMMGQIVNLIPAELTPSGF